jgi:hypothetical protein
VKPTPRPKRRKALLRYLAIATVLVVAAVAIVAGYANRKGPGLKITSVNASVPPKASQTQPPSARKPQSFRGDAPWALSALPECFSQLSKTVGPQAYVMAHLPAGLSAARSGEVLYSGDCKLQVRGETILVDRGSDRMRIPPPVRIYYGKNLFALLRGGVGGLELRVYQAAAGAGPMKL